MSLLKTPLVALGLSLFSLLPTQARELVTGAPAIAQEAQLHTIEKQLVPAIQKCLQHSVALSLGGVSSGVIVSADGLVLTAGHVAHEAQKINQGKKTIAKVRLEDEREFEAELLGFDLEIDLALFKITNPPEKPLPYCELAESNSKTGDFCFVLAHPSGKMQNRPAQARLGRIYNIPQRAGKDWFMMADCEIQPGDSGGPLFDLDGKLIGIASSAAGHQKFNRYAAIKQFYANRQNLLKPGYMNGDYEKGLAGQAGYDHKFTDEELVMVKQALMQRIQDRHQETLSFVKRKLSPNGELKIDLNELLDLMLLNAIAIVEKRPYGYGLDDPALLKPAMPQVAASIFRYSLDFDGKSCGYACRIAPDLLLAVNSLVPSDAESLKFKILKSKLTQGGEFAASVFKRFPKHDAVLLSIDPLTEGPVLNLKKANLTPNSGTLALACSSIDNNIVLGNVMGPIREVKSAQSIGPVSDNIPISEHRSPFKSVYPHSVPLYVAEAGTPIFDLQGRFLGIHLCRASRTTGLLLPATQILKLIQSAR